MRGRENSLLIDQIPDQYMAQFCTDADCILTKKKSVQGNVQNYSSSLMEATNQQIQCRTPTRPTLHPTRPTT